jgi:hypothetical protein
VEIESMEAILKGFDDAFRGPSIIDAMEREKKHVAREGLKSPSLSGRTQSASCRRSEYSEMSKLTDAPREPTTYQARYIANEIVMLLCALEIHEMTFPLFLQRRASSAGRKPGSELLWPASQVRAIFVSLKSEGNIFQSVIDATGKSCND